MPSAHVCSVFWCCCVSVDVFNLSVCVARICGSAGPSSCEDDNDDGDDDVNVNDDDDDNEYANVDGDDPCLLSRPFRWSNSTSLCSPV